MTRRRIIPRAGAAALLLLCICRFSSPAGAADPGTPAPLVISVIANEQTHALAEAVLTEAYRRIHQPVTFDPLPAKRALEWANQGETDGDAARISGTENSYPNLIPVPTPVITFKGIAFSRDAALRVRAWADLRGLRVGVIRGIRYSTIGTEGLDRFFARDMPHLFTLLDHGRIQVAVAVLDAGEVEIARHFKGSGIQPVGQPLHTAPLFHFLHRRHRDLVQRLDPALQTMWQSGAVAEIRERTIHQLISAGE